MKSHSSELLDRSISAMISAIEIYNKPNFEYREETFSILAINSWELLFKAKWLLDHNNKLSSIYVYENKCNKDGKKSKKKTVKHTRSGNPFTYSLDDIAKKLIFQGKLNSRVWDNIQALLEFRDSATHFYNYGDKFLLILEEISIAALKNYVTIIKLWFNKDLSTYNFYIMPLSFAAIDKDIDLLVLNSEEKKFLKYVGKLDKNNTDEDESGFAVILNLDMKFTKSKSHDAINVVISDNDDAIKIKLTEEQIREKYPWDYNELTTKCRDRYEDFKTNEEFQTIKRKCLGDKKYAIKRLLDPNNSNSSSKIFYNPNVLKIFDKHYIRKIKSA